MKALLWKSSVSTYVDDLTWLINFSRTKRCFYFWQLLCSERSTARPTAVTVWPRKEPPWTNLSLKFREVCKGALQTLLPRTHWGRVACRLPSHRVSFSNAQSLTLEYEGQNRPWQLRFVSKISASTNRDHWDLMRSSIAWGAATKWHQGSAARVRKKKEFIPKMNFSPSVGCLFLKTPWEGCSKEIAPSHASSEVHWNRLKHFPDYKSL